LTRHFDHVQHLPLVASALARNPDVLEGRPAVVAIDVDNVPLVDIKPDVKPKKPKADAAPAAAAPADKQPKQQKQAPVDKVVSDKKKGEQAGAPAAGKEGGKKGDKKDKPAKEKKAPAPAPVAEAPAPWMVDLRVGKIVEGASSFIFLCSSRPCRAAPSASGRAETT